MSSPYLRKNGKGHRSRSPKAGIDLLFTDLDGTLLDPRTYHRTAAQPALQAVRRRRLPLVMVTSKTAAEVWPLLRALRLREPFVVENGGAIFFPARRFPFRIPGSSLARPGWRKITLGRPRARLVEILSECARWAGVRVRGFRDMSTQEISKLTGLGTQAADRARRREYDEPFVILYGDTRAWSRLRAEIRRRGLQAIRGGRLFHILGASDKGTAVRRVTGWYRRLNHRRVFSAGLGDSPNDIPMLRAVDVPILVSRPDGQHDLETLAAVPHSQNGRGAGPEGWNRAVLDLLKVGRGNARILRKPVGR